MKRRSRYAFSLLAALLVLLLLPGCQKPSSVEFEPWSEGDLRSSLMLVHNGMGTPHEWDEAWRVEDEAFQEEVIAILCRAEPFRPVLTSEQVFDEEEINPPLYAVFQQGGRSYTVTLFQMERQLSRESPHRDTPLICIGEYELTTDGCPSNENAWYCSLSVGDYAGLVDLLMRYSGDYYVRWKSMEGGD